jgi:flagellar hook protein FlgE
MSIGSFSASLSGLNANQQKLSVIGNNLANLNTVAYKSSMVNFADLVSQSVGGPSANPMQIGLGVTTGEITPNFSQGSLENTGIATNVAIQGSGFFVVGNDANRAYTRAGNFGFNADGQLQTADGQPVQGYTAIDPLTGKIDTSGPPANIVVKPGVLREPVATTSFGAVINLDAGATTGATFGSSVQIVDALGVTHIATATFTRTATPGQWTYKVTVPGEEVTDAGAVAGTPFTINSGTLGFNNEGKLSLVNGASTADVTITSPTWANGAKPTDFSWDLLGANNEPTITGYSSPSATASVTQNGVGSAAPSTVIVIDKDGFLVASFGVGQTLKVAQLAMANFANPGGLVKIGTNLFSASDGSGAAVVGIPGTGSRGTIVGSALEQSNVDIAHEFTQMILAQRGYQASSKGITVADELLVDTLNLKR